MVKREKKPSGRTKIRAFFQKNVGRKVTTEEIAQIAGIRDYQRRIRELRDEEGYQILSHRDRDDLRPNEYLLDTLKQKPAISRSVSDKLRLEILERNGNTCQVCGAGAGEDSGCAPGTKCRLEVDHIVPISQGGLDEANNLRAVCQAYNKNKANLKSPKSRDAIHLLTTIRGQPRNVQLEVYEFLRKKFGDKSKGV